MPAFSGFSPRWLPALANRGRRGLPALALWLVWALGGWLLAGQLWSLVFVAPPPVPAAGPALPEASTRLADRHLFGQPAAGTAESAAADPSYQLLGVIAGPGGRAVFRNQAGVTQVVKVGEELGGAGRLVAVDKQAVRLRRPEGDVVLRLPEKR